VSEHRVLVLRNGIVATCAFAALVVLAIFYSTVSAAVERAARHRVGAAGTPTATALAPPAPSRRAALFARSDN
jgi:hypothetical protein